MTQKEQSFETSLDALEKIVRQLEDGDLSLDESLKLFEEGVRLASDCKERLNEAERRIEMLLKESSDGEPALKQIDPATVGDVRENPVAKRYAFSDEEEDVPF